MASGYGVRFLGRLQTGQFQFKLQTCEYDELGGGFCALHSPCVQVIQEIKKCRF